MLGINITLKYCGYPEFSFLSFEYKMNFQSDQIWKKKTTDSKSSEFVK